MDIETIEYSFGKEFRVSTGNQVTSILLKVGETLYYWCDDYTMIKNEEHDIHMMYSDVFGLRFMNIEDEYGKALLRDMFLPGMKRNHNLNTYQYLDSETSHKMYCRDLLL
ncbi:hypothetical protein ABKT77_07630 [Enterobacter cloacae]|uniref:hypothetical protein n=1 Tax=Enterobacter cloacae TaxID=550 RepID=UPI0032AFAD57